MFLIQGAVFEVSRQMGTGFLEAVYQECLALELAAQNIPFEVLPALALTYKGQPLKQTYRPDLVCFSRIIVELKVVRELAGEHRAQVLNYLKASACWRTSDARRRRVLSDWCSDPAGLGFSCFSWPNKAKPLYPAVGSA